ncbi:MAG TPA: histidine phosphotransferase family protein [Hyphomicrobiales bacterium]|nr:histidine phosphotransferase family protein [Hyphomicrobiales bacterium]
MGATSDIDPLDLTSLVASRLCHDVISPVGAIINGLEVLEEGPDPQTREFALELIKKSARQASARLQFARLAFGAAGSAGAAIDLGDAENVARGLVLDGKTELVWQAPRRLLPKNQVKLLLNLVVIALAAVPRGGTVTATVSDGEEPQFTLVAAGTNARVPGEAAALLSGDFEGALDAHVIQPFFAGYVARAAGMAVTIAAEGERVTISAVPVNRDNQR